MKVYIASDMHYRFVENEEISERHRKVLGFLDLVKEDADMLILNGDIFDLWCVWDTVIIKGYFQLLRKLADITDAGCKIVFIAGNHDFWFSDFLEQELGFQVETDIYKTEIDGKKIIATHGDIYTASDSRYKLFRMIVRNRFVKRVFKLLHPDLALKLGMLMSRSSRNVKHPKELEIRKENGLKYSAQQFLKECDIVFFGHSHKPMIIEYKSGIYANSGDWVKHQTYLVLEDGNLKLQTYKER